MALQRRPVEWALRASEERFRSILDRLAKVTQQRIGDRDVD
jgi:hypothetical protein